MFQNTYLTNFIVDQKYWPGIWSDFDFGSIQVIIEL